MKIVITDSATVSSGDLSFDFLNRYGEVTAYDLTSPEQVAERIADADMVLCNKTPINRQTVGKAEKLRYIGLFATGFNNIDLELAKERNIPVCNVPGYSTDAVAQLTFAFILELANRVCDYNGLVAKGDWIKSRAFSFFPLPLFELAGKTIGIIGFGSIGRQVAKIAAAFNMNVLFYNRSPKSSNIAVQVSLDRLLAESDIVTLHCPLNKESEKLINTDTIAKMKPGAILINTARGAVVDEQALAKALNSGRLGGAGIDVLNSEPMSPDCPLLGAKNCIITPHIAWAGLETRKRLLGVVEENIKAFLSGKPVNNVAE